MPKQIAFLHTSPVHIQTFTNLLADLAPDAAAHHIVDEALLADARAHGLTPEITARVQSRLDDAGANGAAVVVCTCSTIGGVAESLNAVLPFETQRIDRAMADEAVRNGPNILVVAALESTLEPTRELVLNSAETLALPANITMHHISDAWQHFEAGDNDQYWRSVADAIRANAVGQDVVVIAQASMAGATAFCTDLPIPILSSPHLGVQRALAAAT